MATRGTDVDGGSSSGKNWVQVIMDDLEQVAKTKRSGLGLKPRCTMFRVSPHLRDVKPEDYTPREISLGLFNRNPMGAPKTRGDKLRLAIAQTFLEVVGKEWMDVCKLVVPKPSETLDLYDEIGRDPLSLDEVQSVLTLDAIFLTCFLGFKSEELSPELEGCQELITVATRIGIMDDIVMVENQIPFKLIQNVVHILLVQDYQAHAFLRHIGLAVTGFLVQVVPGCPKNRGDFCEMIEATLTAALDFSNFLECDSLLECGYRSLLHNDRTRPDQNDIYGQDLPSATRLRQAGIEFRGIEGGFHEMRFEPGIFKAVLHLPVLKIAGDTESEWRNLLAFEQMQCCDVRKETYKYHQFGSFIDFMDNLIDDDNDVMLLTKGNSPVIRMNTLGTNGALARLFNHTLKKNCILHHKWLSIKKEIFAYYKWVPRKIYLEFIRTNFGKPWFVLSLLAAVSLLTATILQTMNTIFGYYYT